MLILELLILALLLAFVLTRESVRQWRATLKPGDTNLLVLLTLLLISGHFIDAGGNLFPLIRWGMYTRIYEPEQIQWAELQVTFSDNTRQTINPALEFPSIARNFSQRLSLFVRASDQGKLDARHEQTYRELLNGYAEKLNLKDKSRRVTQITALLCSVKPRDRSSLEKRTVNCFVYPGRNAGVTTLIESSSAVVQLDEGRRGHQR